MKTYFLAATRTKIAERKEEMEVGEEEKEERKGQKKRETQKVKGRKIADRPTVRNRYIQR